MKVESGIWLAKKGHVYFFNHSYGRVEELVYFAGLKEQYETLIHHYVQVLYKSSSSINISSTVIV